MFTEREREREDEKYEPVAQLSRNVQHGLEVRVELFPPGYFHDTLFDASGSLNFDWDVIIIKVFGVFEVLPPINYRVIKFGRSISKFCQLQKKLVVYSSMLKP